MSRPTDKTPPPQAASGPGRSPPAKPGCGERGSETFGRFLGTLARLEGRAGGKSREPGR
jgi:hypothetical protein